MENNGEKKAAKRDGGTKQEPLKVVYISNPMKLQTSVSDFRSIVQELTGQHAVWPVDPSKYVSNSISSPADSPAAGAASSMEAALQPGSPLDEDVLIHHHMLHYMLHDHQDFTAQPPNNL